jgi:hypothetical protein
MWNPILEPRDWFSLAGQRSPGLCDVRNAAELRDFAIKQPPFSTGAIILFKRRELARFDITLRLYTVTDFFALDAWRPLIDKRPDARTRAIAYDIEHPLLTALDIRSVVVQKIYQLDQTNDGEWSLRIDFLENRGLPKQTLAKLDGSQSSPVDPVDQEILTKNAAIKARADELAR